MVSFCVHGAGWRDGAGGGVGGEGVGGEGVGVGDGDGVGRVVNAYFLEKHRCHELLSLGEKIVGEFYFHFCIFLEYAKTVHIFKTRQCGRMNYGCCECPLACGWGLLYA